MQCIEPEMLEENPGSAFTLPGKRDRATGLRGGLPGYRCNPRRRPCKVPGFPDTSPGFPVIVPGFLIRLPDDPAAHDEKLERPPGLPVTVPGLRRQKMYSMDASRDGRAACREGSSRRRDTGDQR